MVACAREPKYYIYVIATLVSFLGGLVLLVPCRIIWYIWHTKSGRTGAHGPVTAFSRVRAHAHNLIYGHSTFSKVIVCFGWFVDMAAIILYLTTATLFQVDICGEVLGDPAEYTWLAFNGLFIVRYIIRFLAAPDKLYMWLDLHSVVDHFTIVPAFVGLYLNSNWLAFRYMRLMSLLDLPGIFQSMHLIKSRPKIRLWQALCIFLACWLASSGFVQVCENAGDPQHNWQNANPVLTYWQAVYWLLVTMSTVGFGEYYPHTDIGRAFIVLYIIGTFAMFTSIVPEVVRSLGHNSKYNKAYKRTYGKKHIVVCGHITTESVSNFIKNFIHEDADSRNIDVVFLDLEKPSLELEAFFKRHFGDVCFIQGTVMDLKALRKVKLSVADACLILANRSVADPNEEDGANIMRATAVKNFDGKIRVIIQLLQYNNKMHLMHIPHWRWDVVGGDDVICVDELKNGLLAQNCLAPGVATLLSNLFSMRSYKPGGAAEWLELYKYGTGHEIYTHRLPAAFSGFTFTQAAEICYSQLNILLLGVDVSESEKTASQKEGPKKEDKMKLKVNPGDSVCVHADMRGFFIAQSPQEVERLDSYGSPKDRGSTKMRNCNEMNLTHSKVSPEPTAEDHFEFVENTLHHKHMGGMAVVAEPVDVSDTEENPSEHVSEIFDVTGNVFWRPPVPLEDTLLDADDMRIQDFRSHVVVLLNTTDTSHPIGLASLLAPLRTSNLQQGALLDIVLVGSVAHLAECEWHMLGSFPRVFTYNHCPQHRCNLRALNIHQAAMVVIMTGGRHVVVDKMLVDKESVLSTLTLSSMYGQSLERRIQSFGVLTNLHAFRQQSALTGQVPMITEIENLSNIAWVDADDEDDPDTPVYLTTPYLSGRAFCTSVLDSLVSGTYMNPELLTLIRALVTGGETTEFEKLLAEGLGIVRRATLTDHTAVRNRSRLAQLDLSSGPLEKLPHDNTYSSLVVTALRRYSVVCLGLFRIINPQTADPRERRRVVLTCPPGHTQLLPSDKVYVLQPFDMKYSPVGTPLSKDDAFSTDLNPDVEHVTSSSPPKTWQYSNATKL